MSRSTARSRVRRVGLAAIAVVAVAQVLCGLAGIACLALGYERHFETGVPDAHRTLAIVAFVALATYLLQGSRRDARVLHLGVLFLLFGVFFALPPTATLAAALPAAFAPPLRLLRSLPVDAFTPALVWLFFRDFPRALDSPRMASFVGGAIGVSLAAAIFMVAVNLAAGFGADAAWLAVFDRADSVSHYWTVVFGLLVPALPLALWRARHAPRDERRRVGFFVAGLAATAVVPVLYAVLPPLFPAVASFFALEPVNAVLRPLSLAMNLAFAGVTAYAVVVQRVLDVRTVLRKAAQYGLARLVVGALGALPFALALVLVYRGRQQPLAELFVGPHALQWLALAAAALAVLRLRGRLTAAVDRLFFREAYDARRILAGVTERSRSAESSGELARALTTELDRALHLESIGLLVTPPTGGAFVPVHGTARQLEAESPLAQLLAKDGRPRVVDLERPSPELAALSEEDRVWIADAGAEVLVPLVGSARSMAGILCLGPKRSELAFTREDLQLLDALGGAAGIGLENLGLRESAGAGRLERGEEHPAAECVRCGQVLEADVGGCTACGGSVRGCPLPLTLFGKFRLERRIGSGGMGVVYRALDVTLERTVALKTLPATDPADAARLRREARAMAAIAHPNLALIFGAETYGGTPILVIEHLGGGTLTERLAGGALEAREALGLSAALADALACAHGAGLLHRDVKPSNVGFTEEGVPKLLDFGLVRIAGREPAEGAAQGAIEDGLTESGLLGTPLYMSPEALAGGRPDPTFDLWSLGVVTFEVIAGRHPFERESGGATLAAIQRGDALDLAEVRPDCPEAVRALLGRLLARDRSDRPGTARQLAGLLRETAQAIAQGDAHAAH